jgi:hypothetical protein
VRRDKWDIGAKDPEGVTIKQLYHSSRDQISRALQPMNDGKPVTPKAAFAATMLQVFAQPKLSEDQQPPKHLIRTMEELDARFTNPQRAKMDIIDQEAISKI